MLALFSSAVLAYSTITLQPMTDHIVFGQKAVFSVTIANERTVEQTYTIFSPTSGIGWAVQTRPLRHNTVTIGAGQSMTIMVEAEPIEKFAPGVYIVGLHIGTEFGEAYQQPLKIYMGPVVAQEYLPSLRTTVDMDDKIDPREPQTIRVIIENLNPLDLQGTVVKVMSEIPELNLEQKVDLLPNGQRTVDFTVKLSPYQQPKHYTLFFQFERGDEILKVVNRQIEVVPLELAFTRRADEKYSFLKKDWTVTFKNPGNVRNTQVVGIDVGFVERAFISTQPEAQFSSSNGQYRLLWSIELSPGEEKNVMVARSYRLPVALVVILLLLWFAYTVSRSSVQVVKSAVRAVGADGGLSVLKVTLVVKNIRGAYIKDVEILDQVPNIAAVEKDVEVGTLKPLQVLQNKKGGIFVKWKLSELEGKEERLITYKIRSRLNVIGMLRLPSTKVTYTLKNGRRAVVYSNPFYVRAGE